MPARQRKFIIITLGGTIAMQSTGRGLSPKFSAVELSKHFRVRAQDFNVDWLDFAQVASPDITFAHLVELAAEIDHLHARGYAGCVVLQGTDTLEETAFALELLVQAPIAIALTGAMRANGEPGADGPANLQGALQFLDAASLDRDVVVVLGDRVHHARFVYKQHTTDPAAFGSGEVGLRGRIQEGRFIAINSARTPLTSIRVARDGRIPRVELTTICMDQSPLQFEAAKKAPADGWVIGAMGGGHVPAQLVPHLEQLGARIPEILCTRANDGAVCTSTYGYPGAEIDLLSRGLIHGGNLSTLKARVLLTLLLMESASDCQRRFANFSDLM